MTVLLKSTVFVNSDEDSEAENMVPDNLPETEAMKKSKQVSIVALSLSKHFA